MEIGREQDQTMLYKNESSCWVREEFDQVRASE